MNRPLLALFLLLFPMVGLSAEGSGQLVGTVVDEAGSPIPNVLVQLRAGDTPVVSTRSDGSGAFRFEERRVDAANRVVAERMGYRQYQGRLESGEQRLTIVMERAPIPVDGVAVAATRACEDALGDDRTGRLLWELARERYEQGFDTLGIASYVRQGESRSEKPVPEIPLPDALEKRQRGSAPLLRARWDYRVREEGYGYRVRRISSSAGPYESWVYPPLEAGFAPHFVSETFGELHHLQFLGTTSAGWRVAFCPVEDERVAIEGTLTIAPDTTLVEAEWRFRTPEPVESAGGRAVFDSTGDGDRLRPLPREGLFWRELPDGRHRHEYTLFEEWRVAQGDSVPFLPPREEGKDPEPASPP